VLDDDLGRMFVLRIPDLGGVGDRATFVSQGQADDGFFVSTSAVGEFTSFINGDTATAESLYEAIVNQVDVMTGQSVRWMLIVDVLEA